MSSANASSPPSPSRREHRSMAADFRFHLAAGVLTVVPLGVTFLIIQFIFRFLSDVGSPWVRILFGLLDRFFPQLPPWLTPAWLESLLAILLIILALYVLGRVTTHVIGQRFIHAVDALMARIPFAKTVYGNTKKLLSVLERKPGERFNRVVLIDFPRPGMKAIGFVTSHLKDEKTSEELVSVFVPTTPNPTSGYLEVVPLKNVVMTDWGIEEAMQYIISGGTGFPPEIPFSQFQPPEASAADKGGK